MTNTRQEEGPDLTWMEAVRRRRSVYALSDEVIVPEARIEALIRDILPCMPSAMNSQSTRLLLLFGPQHQKLWAITLDILRERVKPKQFEKTREKITKSFAAGYGTVLFFEDRDQTAKLAAAYPRYAETYPVWSQHTNAMHQYAVWTALEAEGLGASLQHYNPLIDEAVREAWNLPESWMLTAQMPFGKPLEHPEEKEKEPTDTLLQVFR